MHDSDSKNCSHLSSFNRMDDNWLIFAMAASKSHVSALSTSIANFCRMHWTHLIPLPICSHINRSTVSFFATCFFSFVVGTKWKACVRLDWIGVQVQSGSIRLEWSANRRTIDERWTKIKSIRCTLKPLLCKWSNKRKQSSVRLLINTNRSFVAVGYSRLGDVFLDVNGKRIRKGKRN